jgi:hypothetical protein
VIVLSFIVIAVPVRLHLNHALVYSQSDFKGSHISLGKHSRITFLRTFGSRRPPTSTNESRILSFSKASFLSLITSDRRLPRAITQILSLAFFCVLKAFLRIKPCKKERISMRIQDKIIYFQVHHFCTFRLLYARLSVRSFFDMVERPASSVGNPIFLAIFQQTDISLLSGRQYRKSSSSVPLYTKALFGYFSSRA